MDIKGGVDDTFRSKKGAKKENIEIEPELVAVEFGYDIRSVTNELGRAILENLEDTSEYKLHNCGFEGPEEPDDLNEFAKGYDC